MNKVFKTILVGSLVVMTIVLGLVGFVFYKLPSAGSLSKAVHQSLPSAKNENVKDVGTIDGSVARGPASTVDTSSFVQPKAESTATEKETGDKIFRDLTSMDMPLSNFCGSLKNASLGSFSEDEFGDALVKSVDPEKQDPRIQATKPLLRYMMRLPAVSHFVSEIDSSVAEDNQGILNKAKFYGLAYSAFNEMKQHQGDLESVLDRSYLLMNLNNLVAKKPELINNPRVQNFCNSTETLFNQATPVDFEREKKDFLGLLNETGVKPQDIEFDPSYKSNLDLKFENNSLTMNGGWLENLIHQDPDDGEEEPPAESIVK